MHLQRNVLTKVPRRLRPRVAREVSAVFTTPSLAEARGQLARLVSRWGKELPEAMACLEAGFAGAGRVLRVPGRALETDPDDECA